LSPTDDRTGLTSSRYVRATVDCASEHLSLVGGKAVGLGSLLRAGQRVPASFVVTCDAFADFVANGDTAGSGKLRDEVRQALAEAYDALCEERQATVTAAVRSSATVEDSRDASFAGQFRTFLGARGAESVIEQIELCWVTAASPHVDSYRRDRITDAGEAAVAVIVQELVHARASGVMFTQHPRTGDRSLVVIESSHGLGEAVVGGEVIPDLFEVNKITGGIHDRRLGTKAVEHLLSEDGGSVHTRAVELERQQSWSISDAEIAALLTMAADLEAALGRGLDIEWAIGGTGSDPDEEALFALQVRPITVDAAASGATPLAAGNPIDLVLGRLSRHHGSGAE
jgi:phosphoenolpyruvate synthase/pyruvate phosphate dikinase